MRHFFLDTNVVFDYLGRREPNGAAAVALFQAAYDGRATLYVASLSFSHVFYTLRKQFGPLPAREALRKLAKLVRVVAVDEVVVQAALESDFTDVEDAMQYFAALAIPKLTAIVTGDPKGFKAGALSVVSPQEALQLLAM
jgi:predicted nucleic acid-binding protein